MAAGWFTVEVVDKRAEAEDIFVFELANSDGSALPAFDAGAHVEVLLGGSVRHYSLCNSPIERHRYLLGILREEPGRGGSRMFCDSRTIGDVVTIRGPHNRFRLVGGASQSILIAGGIGVTPLIAMAEQLAAKGSCFELHYLARTRARTAFFDRLTVSAFAPSVQFHFDDGPAEQQAQISAILGAAEPGKHVYICGPGGMMDAAIAIATKNGWHQNNIHTERFANGGAPAAENVENGEFHVEINSTGQRVLVLAGQTVVRALAEAKIQISTSCEEGICGTCIVGVLDGVPDHRDAILTDEERLGGKLFVPCCSRAKSNVLVLDL